MKNWFLGIALIIVIVSMIVGLVLLCNGCSYYRRTEKGGFFIGYGSAKEENFEIVSEPPIKDIFSFKLGGVE